MEKRACAALAVINFLLIAFNIIFISSLYMGAYKTFLFWGINLYVFTSSILMVINKKESVGFIALNIALTLISFIWLIVYMPKFTPNNAVKYISAQKEFDGANEVYLDASNPLNNDRASFFIKNGYNIIVDYGENNKERISFNPRSGKYKIASEATINSSQFSDFAGNANFDQEFLDEVKSSNGDKNKYKSLLIEYRSKYAEEVRHYYNLIIETMDEEEKEKFRQDQYDWRNFISQHRDYLEGYYSTDNDEETVEISGLESECYQYRIRSEVLKYMYIKITGQQ